jgi:two-component system, cell cycle response regulator
MRVLVADDDIVTRRLLESSLRRWGYDVAVACDGLEASQILKQPDAPHLVVLDWQMPGMDGIELCRQLRLDTDESNYTYILLLTANQAQNEVVEGLEAGADDYITKPFDLQELKVRLRSGKRIVHLLQQLTSAREALRDLAARDPLTSLWNHNSIIELLDSELQRAERQGTSVGVVLVDLDFFKRVNDTHGHLVGDDVLRKAADVMRGAVRPYDAVGRFGGEEFLIVLPGCDQVNAVSHAERLRLALGRVEVVAAGNVIQFTASAGVSLVESGNRIDAQAAIAAADAALYAAKRAGRNRVEFFDASPMLATAL